MGQRRGDLVEVELDDDASFDEGPRRPSPARRLDPWWRSLPARTRSGLTRLGTVLAAVGCLTVMIQQGTAAADEAALELLAGRSVSLDQPLSEAWHLDGAYPVGWVDGDLVVTTSNNLADTQRIDTTTGAVRWSSPNTGWCSPLSFDLTAGLTGSLLPNLDGMRLICMPVADVAETGLDAANHAVLLDPADGTTSAGPSLDGSMVGLFPVGKDVVAATATADGRAHAMRWSPDSGRTIWTYTSPDTIFAPASGYGSGLGLSTLEIYGNRNLTIDLATGREVTPGDELPLIEPRAPSEVTLADGSTARGTAGWGGKVDRTAADGTPLASLPGWPVPIGVDDGSGADVVLVATPDQLMTAVDLATGSTLWSTSGSAVVAVMDKLVLIVGPTTISARDVRTGKVAWSNPIPADLTTGTAVTDGHSVAYLTTENGKFGLRTLDLRTGVERSTTPLAGYGAWLLGAAQDGTILITTYDGRLSGLRP